ncbi:hypothetical protein VE02_10303, partial [Pseudogymnoascus sp. 03VT05]
MDSIDHFEGFLAIFDINSPATTPATPRWKSKWCTFAAELDASHPTKDATRTYAQYLR